MQHDRSGQSGRPSNEGVTKCEKAQKAGVPESVPKTVQMEDVATAQHFIAAAHCHVLATNDAGMVCSCQLLLRSIEEPLVHICCDSAVPEEVSDPEAERPESPVEVSNLLVPANPAKKRTSLTVLNDFKNMLGCKLMRDIIRLWMLNGRVLFRTHTEAGGPAGRSPAIANSETEEVAAYDIITYTRIVV